MPNKSCCIIGQKIIKHEKRNDIFEPVQEKINTLIDEGYNEFIFDACGKHFNDSISMVIFMQKLRQRDIKTVCYAMNDENAVELQEIYDKVILHTIEKSKKFSIIDRYQAMIDNSDYCIFYIANKSGDLTKLIDYAKDKNKHFINIAQLKTD